MLISTRDLRLLPDAERLRRLMQSMAMLDAILCPEWEYRYYSFNSRWSKNEQMGSMRNGQGDDLFALFNKAGCFLKGFAHEAQMTPYRNNPSTIWPGIFEAVPSEFNDCLKVPAFTIENTTFCIWNSRSDRCWQRGVIEFPSGQDPDGSEMLLSPLDGDPHLFKQWAESYYEVSIDLIAVQHVYEHKLLSEKVVRQINPEASLEKLKGDIEEIGYSNSECA